MDVRRTSRVFIAAAMLLAAASCKKCEACEDENEEEEEKNLARDHFWRVQLAITGKGRVKTLTGEIDCASDGAAQSGACGPTLFRFKEMRPPTMQATAAPGWTFDHWDSVIREPDGGLTTRRGPMPDGPVYLNGFGYSDTGELETVTAVFVLSSDAGGDRGDGAARGDGGDGRR